MSYRGGGLLPGGTATDQRLRESVAREHGVQGMKWGERHEPVNAENHKRLTGVGWKHVGNRKEKGKTLSVYAHPKYNYRVFTQKSDPLFHKFLGKV
jgi:hypothetical protein